MKKHTMRGNLMLLLTAFIWGTAFVAQRAASDNVPAFTFMGVRYVIAVLVLIPVIIILDKRKERLSEGKTPMTESEKADARKTLWIGGTACGIVLAVASNFQQFGVTFTTSGKAGFITALYVVIVPLLGMLFHKKVRLLIWACVVIAVVGLYLLAIKPGTFSLGKGDFLVLICAFFFATHIMVIDHFSPKADGVKLSVIQFAVAGVISLAGAFMFENVSVDIIMQEFWPIFYAGAFSGGVAYTVQIVAQKDADPTIASLILSMESVFAVLAGWALLNEVMTARELLGCALVFIAIVVAQLPTKDEWAKRKSGNVE